ncbi:HEPN domain-containing protein [Acidianus sp. HS-5]|uniref:HEPN domain-containing protein n=1 Tax=Acidianus sp. HS-5 TaxID=2886040 RepID=UPI001F1BFFBA|nr:HEPN domain-containing protein [Acidianus sp. HS-5]BDC17852.1 DNA-binding protein [Acidianus sp. HS-5]
MSKKEVVDAFKSRSLRFFEEAVSDVEKGWYDFTLFHLEQSLQLALKAVILENKGSYPFTHDIDELINCLGKTEVMELRDKNKDVITLLKLAYTGSRYFPTAYDKEIAVKLLT